MAHQVDPLLFWLEQEPASSSEDAVVFLPADTPTDNSLNRYNYQLGKKGHIRKFRTLDRLRAYEMDKIASRRKMPHANDSKPRPLVKLEAIKGQEFLNNHKNEFMELFKMTEKYQKGDKVVNKAVYPDSEIHLEEWDPNQARTLQMKNLLILEEHEKEFYRLRSEIFNEARDLGHHQQTASSTAPIQSTDSPPRPPRVSSRDPRGYMTDHRKPQ
ncbi:unnamed protein product [Mucor circinelloides]